MAGVKGRSGGARPGAGRKPGTKNPETIKREALFATLTKNIEDVLVHVENERQMRRHQAEIIPAILRRLTEIEKHLALREAHRGPTVAQTRVFKNARPQAQPSNGAADGPILVEKRPERPFSPKHSAAEALFKRDGT
jgi:hypothetical protein